MVNPKQSTGRPVHSRVRGPFCFCFLVHVLAQFEALYTSSPTTQQTTDLTTAYNALAAAVTSSNITSADLTTIDTDYAAVLAAEGSTSTASFPYFSLVTGSASGAGHNCH